MKKEKKILISLSSEACMQLETLKNNNPYFTQSQIVEFAIMSTDKNTILEIKKQKQQ